MNPATPSKPTGCKPVPLSRRWLRRLLWACVCLISLLTVYYQWENRRSAHELKEARARLIARLGTDDPRALMPPPIADAENYFALPIIESWRKDDHTHEIPPHAFWPENLPKPDLIENEADGTTRVDFAKWAANRDLKGQTPAQALNEELRVTHDLLTQLASGLDRPFSCLKPAMFTALDNTEGDLWEMNIPNIHNMNDRHRELALHLRVAAQADDSVKAQTTARILLRLFPEACASHGTLVSMLVSIATHEIAFEAIQDALSFPVWDERSLTLLQAQLAKDDDLHITKNAHIQEMLWVHTQLVRNRQKAAFWHNDDLVGIILRDRRWQALIFHLGPVGWLDADTALHLRFWLDIIGPDEETAWKHATQANQRVREELDRDLWLIPDLLPNPKRFICSVALPNVGTTYQVAAETLFHRRCLILACELEKHRIKHGAYPATLPVLSGFETHDPARPKQAPGYRLENGGYLLWSAGPDARDDGGLRDKDWLWRMKRTP